VKKELKKKLKKHKDYTITMRYADGDEFNFEIKATDDHKAEELGEITFGFGDPHVVVSVKRKKK